MKRLVILAAVLPVVGLVGLVAKAEFATRSGPTWTVPIQGYDPRDLLRGHYLRYAFEFDWQDGASCGDADRPEAGCCLCLTETGAEPQVRQVQCSDTSSCDGWLHAESVAPPLRYYVPETSALDLETALRKHDAAVTFTSGRGGEPAIGALTLDGRMWQDVVGEEQAPAHPGAR